MNDYQDGEEAGIKVRDLHPHRRLRPSACSRAKQVCTGWSAFRLSTRPSAATPRSHPVFVSPEIDDSITIDIKPEDLRTDTYRFGRQGAASTSTPLILLFASPTCPTNIVVQCQNERSPA